LSCISHSDAQTSNIANTSTGFDFELFLGTNFSQLHGDGERGFSLIGLKAGTFIDYQFGDHKSIGIGLAYNQHGSNPTFAAFSSDNRSMVRLHYLSIPVLISFHGKAAPSSGNKLVVRLGASINRLFSVQTKHPILNDFNTDYEAFDISLRGGISYYISSHSSLSLGYEHAITDILRRTNINQLEGLRSFSFSMGLGYRL